MPVEYAVGYLSDAEMILNTQVIKYHEMHPKLFRSSSAIVYRWSYSRHCLVVDRRGCCSRDLGCFLSGVPQVTLWTLAPFGRWHPLDAGTLWPLAPFGRWSLGQAWTVTFFLSIGKTDKREAETHQRLEECSRRRLWQAIPWDLHSERDTSAHPDPPIGVIVAAGFLVQPSGVRVADQTLSRHAAHPPTALGGPHACRKTTRALSAAS